MASNEEVLLQFSAEDNISSVVSGIESNVTSALESIQSSIESLDTSLSSVTSSVEAFQDALGGVGASSSEFDDVESSATSVGGAVDEAEGSVDGLSSAVDGIDSSSLDDVSSSVSEVSSEFSNAEGSASGFDSIVVSLDASSIEEIASALANVSSGFDEASGSADAFGSSIGGIDGSGLEEMGQDTSALRTNMYNDFSSMSGDVRGFASESIQSASDAEQGWNIFSNAFENNGGVWADSEEKVRSWVKTYSNANGRSIADTRSAMNTFMNMGMSYEETQKAMEATTNYASQFGMTQEQAAKSIQMGFMGAGRSVKKLGLDIKDFKDESGKVDRIKLLNAIMEKTDGASEKYANSFEAKTTRMNNAMKSIKTDFGRELISALEPIVGVVEKVMNAFSQLPQPLKTATFAFGGLVAGAGMLAGPLLKFKAYANMAGVNIGTLSNSIGMLKVGFQELSNGGISSAITAMKNFSSISKASSGAKVVGQATVVPELAGMSTATKQTTTVVKDAEKVAGLSGTASSAGAGMKTTSVGLKSIGQGALSMVAPLLEIAVAVAILLPVLAGIVAEALLLLKGLQLLIDALDFDKVDLKPTIEAIKQLGQAFLEIGIAMGTLTFASLMTTLSLVVSGVTQLINPIRVAGDMLINAGKELQRFQVVEIDESIPQKIRAISQSLGLVAIAMNDLTKLTLTLAFDNFVTLGGLLGTISTAMATVREELLNAGKEIARLQDLPEINEDSLSKIDNISKALESIATAFDSLKSIRDNYNWDTLVQGVIGEIFGGNVDIKSALAKVKEDVKNASQALSEFSSEDIANVDENTTSKIENVSKALEGIAKAFDALKSLRDNYNWDSLMQGAIGQIFGGNVDIKTAFAQIKDDIKEASDALKVFSEDSDGETDGVDEKVSQKLESVSKALESVAKAFEALKSIRDNYNWDSLMQGAIGEIFGGNVDIKTALSKVKEDIKNASQALSEFASTDEGGGMGDVPEEVGQKLERISKALESVASAFNSLKSIRDNYNWDNILNIGNLFDGVDIQTALAKVKEDIVKAGNSLQNFGNLPDIPEDVGSKLKKISDALGSVATSFKSLSSLRDNYNLGQLIDGVVEYFGGTDIQGSLHKVKETLSQAGTTLGTFTSLPEIPDGIPTKVGRIATSTTVVANALNTMNNANFPDVIGLVVLPTIISRSGQILRDAGRELNNLASMQGFGASAEFGTKVSQIANGVKSIGNATTTMNNTQFPDIGGLIALPTIIGRSKDIIRDAGKELAKLAGLQTVPEGVDSKVQKIGSSVRVLGSTVGNLNSVPTVSAVAGANVKLGVDAVKNVARELNNLQGTTLAGGIGQILNSVRNAVVQLRATLASMAGGFRASGTQIGSSIRGGIGQGMGNLSGTVSGRVSSALNGAVGTATSGGSRLGSSATNGFRNSFKIAQIATQELNNAITGLQNGSSQFYSVVRQIAEQAVQEAKNASGVQSPGHIAHMWADEMGYSTMMIRTRGQNVISATRRLATDVVRAFNPNLNYPLENIRDKLDVGRMENLRNIRQSIDVGKQQRPVTLNFGEGAVQLDARNMTLEEARQIMLLSIESLDVVSGINIRGV